MVAGSKAAEPEMEWDTGVKEVTGMAAAKIKAKAKQAEKKAKKLEAAKLAAARVRRAADRRLRTQVRRKFRKLDTDGSGTIGVEELRGLLLELGLKLSKRKREKAVQQMDNDGSGEVDFEEFAAWWTEFNDPDQKKSFFASLVGDKKEEEDTNADAVEEAAKEIKQRAKKKRKGKSLEESDGLWPANMVYVVYFCTWFFCLACGWYTVMTALAFGPELTIAWLGGCITVTVYEAVVQDPVKIGVFVLFSEGAEVWLDLYYDMSGWMPCCPEPE